jgi:hypothetical protein
VCRESVKAVQALLTPIVHTATNGDLPALTLIPEESSLQVAEYSGTWYPEVQITVWVEPLRCLPTKPPSHRCYRSLWYEYISLLPSAYLFPRDIVLLIDQTAQDLCFT